MATDVIHAEQVLARFTDHPSPYFRFPGGCYDHTALAAIAPTGVTVIQYDVASTDAFGTHTAQIVAHILADTRPGSIVVLHITGGDTDPLTAAALPRSCTACASVDCAQSPSPNCSWPPDQVPVHGSTRDAVS